MMIHDDPRLQSTHSQGKLLQGWHQELVFSTFKSFYFTLTLKAKENKAVCSSPKNVYSSQGDLTVVSFLYQDDDINQRDTKVEWHYMKTVAF